MKPTIDYFLKGIKDAEKNLADSKVALSIAELNASSDVEELKIAVSMSDAILRNARCNLYRFENGKMFKYKGRYMTLSSSDADETRLQYDRIKSERPTRRAY